MDNRVIRAEFRAAVNGICAAMRAHTRMVVQTAAEYRSCSRATRATVRRSQQTLSRLREGGRDAPPAGEDAILGDHRPLR